MNKSFINDDTDGSQHSITGILSTDDFTMIYIDSYPYPVPSPSPRLHVCRTEPMTLYPSLSLHMEQLCAEHTYDDIKDQV